MSRICQTFTSEVLIARSKFGQRERDTLSWPNAYGSIPARRAIAASSIRQKTLRSPTSRVRSNN